MALERKEGMAMATDDTDNEHLLKGLRMADDDYPKAAVGDPFAGRCDHKCLLPDGHVERGELHFYGYELPSPFERGRAEERAATQAYLREQATQQHDPDGALVDALRWSEARNG